MPWGPAPLFSLTLPEDAALGDAAIIIGPDLPPCMQPTYASAIFFRPQFTTTPPDYAPIKFWAQVAFTGGSAQQVDEGFAIWDGTSVCGYIVTRSVSALSIAGAITVQDIEGADFSTGVGAATFAGPPSKFWNGIILHVGVAFGDPNVTPLSIDGVSLGRGLRGIFESAVASAAVGAETVIGVTTAQVGFFTGRAYRFSFTGLGFGSVANQSTYRMRIGSTTAGQQMKFSRFATPAGGGNSITVTDWTIGVRVAAVGLTDFACLTLAASAGTATMDAGAGFVRRFHVEDCGDANEYPLATPIV